VRNRYEAFDFNASLFIHLMIRKLHSDRACLQRETRCAPSLNSRFGVIENKTGAASGLVMSLAEIEEAVDKLSPAELAKLAAHIARRDKVAWDEEIEDDFSPGGKHEKALEKIDAEIDAGNFMPLP
jgi:hypothetical protein